MKKGKKTYTILENAALPTGWQKEKMLENILLECRKYDSSPAGKLYNLVAVYPWRIAFGLSAIQAVLCTLIWGTRYTNMILKVFGG
ncbi:MAG: hypothetical protein GX754_05060 [Clostridiaceae bacterium]|nr:hypothetical protein [Clostridiaceae bacterium]